MDTEVDGAMLTRRSIRLALSRSEPGKQSALSAPVMKRRRKDSSGASGENKQARSSKTPLEKTEGEDASSMVIIPIPDDFSISQTACSYGYFLVPPNQWEPVEGGGELRADAGTFSRPLRFGERLQKAAHCVISQAGERGSGKAELKVSVASRLTEPELRDIREQVMRMFQIDADMGSWYHLNEEARRRGFGRLFRSPTLFEDMVKCISACNIKFGGTIRMNKLLCEEFGHNKAFPTPEDLEGVQADDLKERAKVGYRGDRIVRLAQAFRDGSVDVAWLEGPERTRDEVVAYVKNLHGFGDFAASNVAMLLGFYDLVPMDSETVRHFKDYHGVVTKNVREVAPKVRQQYHPYAPYQFLQYWYEMVMWYEKKREKRMDQWKANHFDASTRSPT